MSNPMDGLMQFFNMMQSRNSPQNSAGKDISNQYNPNVYHNTPFANQIGAGMLGGIQGEIQNMNNAQNSFMQNFFPQAGQGMTAQNGTSGILNRMLNTYNAPNSSAIHAGLNTPTNYAPMQLGDTPNALETLRNVFMQGGGNTDPSQPGFAKSTILNALGTAASGEGVMGFAKMPSFGLDALKAKDLINTPRPANIFDEIYNSMPKGSGKLHTPKDITSAPRGNDTIEWLKEHNKDWGEFGKHMVDIYKEIAKRSKKL